MRVLVVDDEVSVCTFIAKFLRQDGFEVAEAFDPARALALAQQLGPTLSAVITDVNMPEMNGFELWKHIKTHVAPDCKVLFMSGESLNEEAALPGDLLYKPFSLQTLKQKLCFDGDRATG